MTDSVETVRQYVARINTGDAAGLGALMTPDHRFVDATGAAHDRGIFANAETVAAFGTASGSFQGKGAGARWSFPAAWRAIVKEQRLAEWRVYADIEAMMRSMGVKRFA
jgi:hypothetical protein